MSDVTYPMISGTGVLQDFVELPSQLYEHWLDRPEILDALRAPLPDRRADAAGADGPADRSRAPSIRAIITSRISRRRPMSTSISTSAARRMRDTRRGRDARAHADARGGRAAPSAAALPAHLLRRPLRGRLLQLSVVRGARRRCVQGVRGGRRRVRSATAKRLRDHVYAAGGARDPSEAYQAFRGRMPAVDPLLEEARA